MSAASRGRAERMGGMKPGCTELARMPSGPYLTAVALVKIRTALQNVRSKLMHEIDNLVTSTRRQYETALAQETSLVEALTASLADPALDPDDERYRVWGYPREVQSGETERDSGVARLTATDIPAGQFVEMRVLVPRTPGQNVTAARVKEGDGLGKILAEEGAKDDDYRYSWARLERFLGENAPLLSLIVAALALGFLAVLWLRARERPTSAPRYLPGRPGIVSPPDSAISMTQQGSPTRLAVRLRVQLSRKSSTPTRMKRPSSQRTLFCPSSRPTRRRPA